MILPLTRVLLASLVLAAIVLVAVFGPPLVLTLLPVVLASGADFVDRVLRRRPGDGAA